MSPLRRARAATTGAFALGASAVVLLRLVTVTESTWVLMTAWLTLIAAMACGAAAAGCWVEWYLHRRPPCEWIVAIDLADGGQRTAVWVCREHRNVYLTAPPSRCPARGVWT